REGEDEAIVRDDGLISRSENRAAGQKVQDKIGCHDEQAMHSRFDELSLSYLSGPPLSHVFSLLLTKDIQGLVQRSGGVRG
ncbi:hypothetical protein PMAYCL1PPCAC_01544, partial [Pristionchus mayeri]